MKRHSNSTDVARRAGVSRTTVSYVLNGRKDAAIPEETRARVRRAAQELGYYPNNLARSLKHGRSNTIGIVLPHIHGAYFARLIDGIEEVSVQHGYHVLLAHSQYDPAIEARQVELLLEHRVDGIIPLSFEESVGSAGTWLRTVLATGCACVTVDDSSFSELVDCVVTDDFEGARIAVRHLLALGHRRIGHISGGTRKSSARDRCAGYRAALAEADIPFDPALVTGESYEIEPVLGAVVNLLAMPDPPTALFFASDYLAAHALKGLWRRGVRIPAQLAMVGYGDLDMSEYLDMTTIRQDAQEMGRRSALRLLQRLEDPSLPPEKIVLPVQLVVRETCGAQCALLPTPVPPASATRSLVGDACL